MMRWSRLLPLLLIALVVAPGCGMLKGNAKKAAATALGTAEQAYAAIAAEANNVAPDQAREIESGIATAHQALDSGDFDGVLKDAKALNDSIKSLAEALPGLKSTLESSWKSLSESVPGALAAADKKLEDFGQPPAGMPGREKYDALSARLKKLQEQWDEARSLAVSGKLAQAVSIGEQVKYDAVKLVTEFQQGS